MIKCELCGKEFKRLRTHLKVAHDITVRTYKKNYPNALLVDPEYAERERVRIYLTRKNENLIPPIKKGEKRALKIKEALK